MNFNKTVWLATAVFFIAVFNAYAQNFSEFKKPGDDNHPITYWQWLNGNITKDGITKDLEAMKAAGINGTLLFSCGFYQPGPVKFMSKQWWDMVAHTIKESDRLHMKFGIYNSDGWSMSGGPWIAPEESMKVIVWADTIVSGGRDVNAMLLQPNKKLIYKDVAVLAFPAIENDAPLVIKKLSAHLIQHAGALTDNNPKTVAQILQTSNKQSAYLMADFGRPVTCRRIVLNKVSAEPFLDADATAEYSNDGKKFIKIPVSVPLNLKAEALVNQVTFAFPQIKARYIRVSLSFLTSSKYTPVTMEQKTISIGDVGFYESPRVAMWEPKSGESKRIRHEMQPAFMHEVNTVTNEQLPAGYKIDASKIINLTKLVDSRGLLTWKAPAGKWIIQRIGYTSTGRELHPSTKEGEGLEVDKMNKKAVEKHFNAYSAKIIDLSNKLIGRPIDYVEMESWEAGVQNWTDDFEKEFKKLNGYDITPYLPILAGGYVVNSYQASDKFLWDFRNTISQLIATNYWATIYKLSKEKGVSVPAEGSGMQHYLYDPIRYMQYADIPMGEFWPNEGHVRADLKNASSTGHIFGHNLVGGESFTNGSDTLWSYTPYDLKQIGDEAFTMGINHYVLHSYVHQPYNIAPGFTLSRFGTHLQRLNPWFNQATDWFTYIARCQYMLRLGKSVQDIACFTGEGIPGYLGQPWEVHPKLPQGFDYDGVNLDAIKQMSVKNGKLYLPSGAGYKLLLFQDIKNMTPELVTEIERLVGAGANIVSMKPEHSPSLSGSAAADAKIRQIAAQVWGKINGKTITANHYNKGWVFSGMDLNKVMKTIGATPDFIYQTANKQAQVNYVHRQSADADIYFVANYHKTPIKATGIFRAGNRVPELWDPYSGTGKVLHYKRVNAQQVQVDLSFDQLGSAFIVFKDNVDANLPADVTYKLAAMYSLNGPWNVQFKSTTDNFNTVFNSLTDWTNSTDKRIKYFSGSATYTKQVKLNSTGKKVMLNLGNVYRAIAGITINGHEVARLWKPPYTVDITPYVKQGENQLAITITNSAVNELVGDEQLPPDLTYKRNNVTTLPNWLAHPEQRQSERKTFVTYKYLTKDSKLDPSGLMGLVSIKVYQ